MKRTLAEIFEVVCDSVLFSSRRLWVTLWRIGSRPYLESTSRPIWSKPWRTRPSFIDIFLLFQLWICDVLYQFPPSIPLISKHSICSLRHANKGTSLFLQIGAFVVKKSDLGNASHPVWRIDKGSLLAYEPVPTSRGERFYKRSQAVSRSLGDVLNHGHEYERAFSDFRWL